MKKYLTVLLALVALPVFGAGGGWTLLGSPLSKTLGNDTGIICGEPPSFSSGWGEDMLLRTNCLYSDANALPSGNVELWWTVVTNCPTIQHNPIDMIYTTYWSPLTSPGLWTALGSVTNNFIETNWLSTRVASDYTWLTNGYYTTTALETNYVSGTSATWQYTTNCIGCTPPSTATNWVKTVGGSGYDISAAFTLDASGNIYLCGYFIGSVNFGPSTLISVGTFDSYVAKYDAFGNCLWAKRFGGYNIGTIPSALGSDTNGNIVVGGYYGISNNAVLDCAGITLTNNSYYDGFLAIMNASDGTVTAAKAIRGTSGNVKVTSLAMNTNASKIVIAGSIASSTDFGNGSVITPSVPPDLYLATYDTSLACQWASNYWNLASTGDGDQVRGLCLDSSGNIFIVGFFENAINFGGGELPTQPYPMSTAGFLVKLNSTGGHIWSKSTLGAFGIAVAVDASGNVFLAGTLGRSTSVNLGATNLTSTGDPSVILAKYNSSGTNLWGAVMGSRSYNGVTDVCIDGSGNVICTGIFNDTANYGGADLVSIGGADGFIVSLNTSGIHQWSYRFGGGSGDQPQKILVDSGGSVIGNGSFVNSADFFGTPLISNGGYDGFLYRHKF